MKGVSAIGKLKSFIKPQVIEVGEAGMAEAFHRQLLANPIMRFSLWLERRKSGGALKEAVMRKQVKEAAYDFGSRALGTVAPLDGKVALYVSNKPMPLSLKKSIIAHERFHTLPIIGPSEILAHTVGAGSSALSGQGAEALRHITALPRYRPGRFAIEAGIGTGGYYGAKRLAKPKGDIEKTSEKRTEVKAHNRTLKGEEVPVRQHTRSVDEPMPGPHSTIIKPIPKTTNAVWDYSLQDHRAKRAGRHNDLRLCDARGNAHSWAIRKMPDKGKSSFAFQTFTHSRKYIDFEGELRGYGAGSVSLADRGLALIHSADDNKVNYSVVHGRDSQDYSLVRLGDKTWIIHNTSAPTPPAGKPKYKDLDWDESVADDPNVVIGAKIDGGHAIIMLEPGKRARAYSPRNTKEGKPIEYTHKIPGLWDVKWGGKGSTELRGEVAAVGKDGRPLHVSVTSGLLNAGLLTSIEKQTKGPKLQVFLFDVTKYNGKDMRQLPYTERMRLVTDIASKHPGMRVAPTAVEKSDKLRMLRTIKAGKYPLTAEGVVVWGHKGPAKMKTGKEFDVFIRDIYRGTGKYVRSAGGFNYSLTPKGRVVGNVGTGFTDKERREMLVRKGDYLGRVARVTAQEKLKSGALRAPSYEALHFEKNYGLEKTAGPILKALIMHLFGKKTKDRKSRS